MNHRRPHQRLRALIAALVAATALGAAGTTALAGPADTTDPAGTTVPREAAAAKPKVWVVSDLSRPGGGTDRDDIVALAAMTSYREQLRVRRVVVGSTTVGIDCDAALDYAKEASAGKFGRRVVKASTCADPEGFTTCDDRNPWVDNPPATVRALVRAIRAGGLTVLNWGPMTETAGAVCWLEKNAPADLSEVTVVSHWTDTSPGYDHSYNCNKDASACAYLHRAAARPDHRIRLVELGAAGQKFVDRANDECGADTSVPDTGLGRYLNTTKDTGTPDLSDGATFLVPLLGGLGGYETDGTDNRNFTRAYRSLCDAAPGIFDHLRAHLT
ncbi:hypothetical protein KBZ10_26645 [Streptomyces sp. F63]|uniref:hypothetical protein n=1 Tax=Streptomyces sp. F63 TaxID=2824887 RepID=UPI001B36080F|nr:hypothetical protein [Streptomyces sp. F63]MBQ0988030.1 hypothetical protein [Streptomyces sp. F63]